MTVMPRIRCPNCGTSINLESRRELDYRMVLSGMQKGSKTFTSLLKTTGLPRKTLCMRLAALRDSGVIIKDGGYRLNGSASLEKWGVKMKSIESQPLTKPSLLTRRNTIIMLMVLVLTVFIAANGWAMLSTPRPPPSPPAPLYIGEFKMDIKIYNSTDVFAWQAVICFNPSELGFRESLEGSFLSANAPYGTVFVFANDTRPGELLVFGSLLGDVPGVSGEGTVATITFGYKTEIYELPEIVGVRRARSTHIWNTDLIDTEGILKLEI